MNGEDLPLPPEIGALLRRVLDGARRVLGGRLEGFSLLGSLALGDFHPGRSDVDFAAVTGGPLRAEEITALAAMHAEIYHSGLPWAEHMEGPYIPRAALRRHDPACSDFPALRVDGTFAVDNHGPDWIIQRWVLRERGLTLFGPPIRGLIDPISPDDLRRSAAGILRSWWAPKLIDQSSLLDPEYRVYAVLTMCRSLYTMERGEVASKPAAARWALAGPAAPWSSLIAEALAWERGMPFERLEDVMDLIRCALQEAR